MVDEASNLCVSNDVTPFYLSDVLFVLFVLRIYCLEKKTPTHSEASAKGG